jgi:Flp pilus assembly protein TadG
MTESFAFCPPVPDAVARHARRARSRHWLGKAMRFAGRLTGDSSGSPAIEFALLGLPFLAFLVAIMEMALSLLAQSALETAAESAARQLLTGQVQTFQSYTGSTLNTGLNATQFQQAICGTLTYSATANGAATSYGSSMLAPYLSCSNLYVNVSVASSISSATLTPPSFTYNSNGAVTATGTGYTTSASGGGQNKILVVQLIYLWPTLSGLFGFSLGTQANGSEMLVATEVISTENYVCPTGVSSC